MILGSDAANTFTLSMASREIMGFALRAYSASTRDDIISLTDSVWKERTYT